MSCNDRSDGLIGHETVHHVRRDANPLCSHRPSQYDAVLPGGTRLALRLGDLSDIPSGSAIARPTGFDGNEKPQSARSDLQTSKIYAEDQTIDENSTPVERVSWTEMQAIQIKSPAQGGLQDLKENSQERRNWNNKHITSRPPPSSPPQYTAAGSYSTPTIPALHQNSVPTLIEHYRDERDADPHNFDQATQNIYQSLLEAKIVRGGSPPLFQNEYSVELASRLDAETVARWAEHRKREEDEMSYFELEGDEDDNINDTVAHTALRLSMPHGLPTHTDQPMSAGSISHQTFEANKITPKGSRVFSRRTVIEICETFKLPNKGTTDHTDIHDASLIRDQDGDNPSTSVEPSTSNTDPNANPLQKMSHLREEINKIK